MNRRVLSKNEKIHFCQIKNLNNSLCIVQPRPVVLDGQYRRRRAYTKQHKIAWISSLEKFKYVRCIFRNCFFIAMSLEDMISHFGYCNGDSSFAKYICHICQGCVTSEEILRKHLEISHSENLNSGNREIDVPLDLSVEKSQQEEKFQVKCIDRLQIRNLEKNQAEFEHSVKSSVDQINTQFNFKGKGDIGCSSKLRELLQSDSYKSEECTISNNCVDMNTRKHKLITDNSLTLSHTSVPPVLSLNKNGEEKLKGRKRGPKPKKGLNDCGTKGSECGEPLVQCGKCKDFQGIQKAFQDHNFKKHVGLGWLEGETPVDLNDEKEVIRLVKAAFKVVKKGTCELCLDVKKSVLGYASHIRVCGKSDEEKDALKVQCPFCSAKCLKYSMPVHIKLSHPSNEEDGEDALNKKQSSMEDVIPSGKRRSALKAATKFQEVLKDIDEHEISEVYYVAFEKGSEKLPKVCTKLTNSWYKLQREKKDIPCRHGDCKVVSETAKMAKQHHFCCPQLPDKVYMCEACEFYSVDESELPPHLASRHARLLNKRKTSETEAEKMIEAEDEDDEENGDGDEDNDEDDGEDEFSDDEGEVGDEENPYSIKKKKMKKFFSERERRNKKTKKKKEFEVEEAGYKKKFCKREGLENDRRFPYFCNSLRMTLEEEISEPKMFDSWPEFNTQSEDWTYVKEESTRDFLPSLEKSLSVQVATAAATEKIQWRRFKRFEGDLIEGVPTMFTGGSVRCLSWCKVSYHRLKEKRIEQYLAIATTKHVNHLRNIHDRSESAKCSLLQIWNCGVLENFESPTAPRFSLGLRHESEIWDLSWFPEDTSFEGSEERLSRVGLLATAADDGIVRIWSICDPYHLSSSDSNCIYETHPVVKLVLDEYLRDTCLRLSIGKKGIIAGGYGNGILAVWNLNNVTSPFSEKEGKSIVIKPHLTIQAHNTAVIALTICPTNSRYISSGALDRVMKLWDLESPLWPIEQFSRELCLSSAWLKNWPLIIYNYDDAVNSSNKGVAKFVRDFFYDKHQPCMLLDNLCLSMSFSDWLNGLCGSNDAGEIRISLLQNFISEQKKNKNITTLSSVRLAKLEEAEKESDRSVEVEPKWAPLKYEDINKDLGLIFIDSAVKVKVKLKKPECHFEGVPIKAVNKVSFNPNFKSFIHVAAGYNCGFVRIPFLKNLQSNNYLNNFIRKHSEQSLR